MVGLIELGSTSFGENLNGDGIPAESAVHILLAYNLDPESVVAVHQESLGGGLAIDVESPAEELSLRHSNLNIR